MKISIVANKMRSDIFSDKETVDKLAEQNDLTYDLYVVEPKQIQSILEKLVKQNNNTILIVGGDGTVRTAAQVMVNENIPLAILPQGTFNYFAKELCLPSDLESAFKIIKQNKIKHVDVGEVNNIIFINHASIGFYSRIMKLRKKSKKILGKNRLLKIIFTSINFLKVIPVYKLKFKVDNVEMIQETCLVFIGNNYHFTELLDFGVPKALTSGLLSIYIFKCKTRWELIKCMFSILFNRFDKMQYISHFVTDNLNIESQTPQINVVIDGDLDKLDSPLIFSIHKRKLAVIVP